MNKEIFTAALILLLAFVLSFAMTSNSAGSYEVVVLCYHHLVEDRKPENDCEITVTRFREHMEFLNAEDYQPLSLQEFLLCAEKGSFPEKAVLLTFDDGYASFYKKAYPILKEYAFPATVFPVVSHMQGLERQESFSENLSFDQLRIMEEESGLIDVGSHSYDLHHYEGERPAVQPSPDESTAEYECRLRRDLRTGRNLLELQTDTEVKALAWPFGIKTPTAKKLAKEAGYEVLFVLETEPFTQDDSTAAVPRFPADALDLDDLEEVLTGDTDQ